MGIFGDSAREASNRRYAAVAAMSDKELDECLKDVYHPYVWFAMEEKMNRRTVKRFRRMLERKQTEYNNSKGKYKLGT